MFKNRRYTRTLGFLMICFVWLFAGQGMGAESDSLSSGSNINEVRAQAKADIEAIYIPRREKDFIGAARLASKFVKKYDPIKDAVVQQHVAEAMSFVADGMYTEKNYTRAIKMHEQIEKKYGKEKDSVFQNRVADSIYTQALLNKNFLNDYKKAVKLFKRVQKEYNSSKDTEILSTVAYAMYQEGLAHKDQGKAVLAKKCFLAVVRDFAKSDEKWLKQSVLNAQKELKEMEE